MAALTTLAVMALTAASTASSASASAQQASAADAQGKYQFKLAQWNAALAEQEARDSIAKGRADETMVRNKTSQTVGSERASAAAQGINVDTGSALDVQAETVKAGELDALTVRNNAARQSYGYKVQAWDARNQGALALAAGKNAATGFRNQAYSTLLTGATSLYGLAKK